MLQDAIYEAQFDMPWPVDPRALGTAGALSMIANRTYYQRVTRGRALISAIAIDISTSSGNLCVSVYRNSGVGKLARPAGRVATSGSVASPGTNRQEIALTAPVLVTAGDWFGIGVDNTTIRITGATQNNLCIDGLGAYEDVGALAAPTTATPVNTSPNRLFLMVGVI